MTIRWMTVRAVSAILATAALLVALPLLVQTAMADSVPPTTPLSYYTCPSSNTSGVLRISCYNLPGPMWFRIKGSTVADAEPSTLRFSLNCEDGQVSMAWKVSGSFSKLISRHTAPKVANMMRQSNCDVYSSLTKPASAEGTHRLSLDGATIYNELRQNG